MITEPSTVTLSCLSRATAGNWEPCKAYEHIHFFLPFSVQHFVWTELNLSWHCVTHSSRWIRLLWCFSQTVQNLTNSVFFVDLVDSQPPFSRSFLNILSNPEGSMEPQITWNANFCIFRHRYLSPLLFPTSKLIKTLVWANIIQDFCFPFCFSPTHIGASRGNKVH